MSFVINPGSSTIKCRRLHDSFTRRVTGEELPLLPSTGNAETTDVLGTVDLGSLSLGRTRGY